jgi:hypothetical protein
LNADTCLKISTGYVRFTLFQSNCEKTVTYVENVKMCANKYNK